MDNNEPRRNYKRKTKGDRGEDMTSYPSFESFCFEMIKKF